MNRDSRPPHELSSSVGSIHVSSLKYSYYMRKQEFLLKANVASLQILCFFFSMNKYSESVYFLNCKLPCN